MQAYFNGLPIFGERGPAGPDGNPVGTVISYMGAASPDGYLVCDGAEHPIRQYKDLAVFFYEQFGEANHFGGDGAVTFAVPDFRNLFLRGYHGEAEEQLSGEIGKKQDATESPLVGMMTSSGGQLGFYGYHAGNGVRQTVVNPDQLIGESGAPKLVYTSQTVSSDALPPSFTARPVNAAVLYCIKARTSVPIENTYSLEEQVIGRWIDGKPIYRKTLVFDQPLTQAVENHLADLSELSIETVVQAHGRKTYANGSDRAIDNFTAGIIFNNNMAELAVYTTHAGMAVRFITIEYTKTTD